MNHPSRLARAALVAWSCVLLGGCLSTLIRSRPGPRRYMSSFGPRGLARTRPLVDELQRIAAARGATPSQVALNWLLHFHGETVVAIPGASRPQQAEEAAGAMGFRLTDEEMSRVAELSRPFR